MADQSSYPEHIGTMYSSIKDYLLVNPQHLDIGTRTSLSSKPLLKLNHLDILETNSSVNALLDNCLGNVHATTHSLIIGRLHAIVFGQLINLDLHSMQISFMPNFIWL